MYYILIHGKNPAKSCLFRKKRKLRYFLYFHILYIIFPDISAMPVRYPPMIFFLFSPSAGLIR